MITQFILDTKHGNKGTPVRLVSLEPGGDWVQLPDGQEVSVKSDFVSSGIHSPEETLSVLATQSGIREDTLLKAAQTDRLMSRRSGTTWLSTLNAVEWAIAEGRLRSPSKGEPMSDLPEPKILAGPFEKRVDAEAVLTDDFAPDVPNPRIVHKPDDNKYYICDVREMMAEAHRRDPSMGTHSTNA